MWVVTNAQREGGEQRAGRNADEGLEAVPQRIESRDLVGDQFGEGHHPGDADDQRMLQHRQRGRQVQVTEMRQRPGEEYHQIETQAAGPGEAGREGDGLRQIHYFLALRSSSRRCASFSPILPSSPRGVVGGSPQWWPAAEAPGIVGSSFSLP